jgi:CheY-like chemotaxis protein
VTANRQALVVDDEPEIAGVLALILEGLGFTVLTAADGEEALELLGRQPVHLILCDVVMPKLRGDALSQRLKAGPATARIPLVLVSSLPPERIPDGRADGFLPKPFALAQVQAVVQQVLA